MALRVKVCGLTEAALLDQAVALGASYVGFVFFPPSPRAIAPAEAARLAERVPEAVQTVGVVVDPTDELLGGILSAVPLDVLQLHGHETPERVREIALRTGARVMKAIRVETADDLAGLADYEPVADMILFDAKPPRDAGWPGGHGLPFDWRLLADLRLAKPWALAGGLTPDNLGAAVELLHPPLVDVSSGIEWAPGKKDPAKLQRFMEEAARAGAWPTRTSR